MSTQTTLNPKRLLGMLLATVMLLSMLPMSAISASAAKAAVQVLMTHLLQITIINFIVY